MKIFGYIICKEQDIVDKRDYDMQACKIDEIHQDNVSLRRWCSHLSIERDNLQRKYENTARESAEILKKYVKANKLISHLEHEIERIKNGRI